MRVALISALLWLPGRACTQEDRCLEADAALVVEHGRVYCEDWCHWGHNDCKFLTHEEPWPPEEIR